MMVVIIVVMKMAMVLMVNISDGDDKHGEVNPVKR